MADTPNTKNDPQHPVIYEGGKLVSPERLAEIKKVTAAAKGKKNA